MRLVLLSVPMLLAIAACSGASDDSGLFDPSGNATNAPSGSNAESPTSPGQGGKGDSTPVADAGSKPPIKDAGAPSSDASTKSPEAWSCASSEAESESNDSPQRANTMATGALCGNVAGDDDDWGRFALPPNAKTIRFDYTSTAEIVVRVHVKGQTIVVGQGTPIPFEAGSEYMVEVRTRAGAVTKRGYRVWFSTT